MGTRGITDCGPALVMVAVVAVVVVIGIRNSVGIRSRSSVDLGLWDYGVVRIADSVQISGAHGLQDCVLLRRADDMCSPPVPIGITRQTQSKLISNHCADYGLQDCVQHWIQLPFLLLPITISIYDIANCHVRERVPRSLLPARGPLRPRAPRPRARRFAAPRGAPLNPFHSY